MTIETEFSRRFGLRLPLVQGPFGGGLSTVKLTATVSNGGGLGSFGAHHLSPTALGDIVRDIRAATSNPFAINLWVSNCDEGARDLNRAEFDAAVKQFLPLYQELGVPVPEYPSEAMPGFDEQMEALLELRPPTFSFVFGVPSKNILRTCRERGIATIGAATTTDEARALEAAGVDAILASGCEAGGHRPAFLKPPESGLIGTFALVPQIVDCVKVPVLAAGGIADARGVSAAKALGAAGVQIGTAFLACEESGAPRLHRDVLFSERARHTLLSRGFTGRLARFARNTYLERYERGELTPLPYPLHSWLAGFIKSAAVERGDIEHMSLYAGQGAPLLKFRQSAALLDALASGL
jgi:nitronate monooxygenase